MLEKQLSSILAEHLRQFIENVNEEQLRVSLWSGELVLHNLTLRPDVLDQVMKLVVTSSNVESDFGGNLSSETIAAARALLLPFTVVSGIVKTLKVSVPWTALQGEPVGIELDGIELQFGPLRCRPYSEEEELNRSSVLQQKELEQYRRFRDANLKNASGGGLSRDGSSAKSDDSLTDDDAAGKGTLPSVTSTSESVTLLTTIARNAHIVLRNISVSYLHDYEGLHPSLASMFELAIDEVFVTTTDEEWNARFVSDPHLPICKEVSVDGLQVLLYSDKRTETTLPDGDDQLTPGKSSSWGAVLPLLEPCDITIRVRFPPPASDSSSRQLIGTTCTIQSSPIAFNCNFGALYHLTLMQESLATRYVDCARFRRHLSLLHAPTKANGSSVACGRWRFAIQCVRDDVRIQRAAVNGDTSSGGGILLFCQIRREYIALFKRSQEVRWLLPLTADEAVQLTALERKLRTDQVFFLRCMSYSELSYEYHVDITQRSLIRTVEASKSQSNSNSRWTSWFRRAPQQSSPQQPSKSSNVAVKFAPVLTLDEVSDISSERKHIRTALEREWNIALYYMRKRQTAAVKAAGGSREHQISTANASSIPLVIDVDVSSVQFSFLAQLPGAFTAKRLEWPQGLQILHQIGHKLRLKFSDVSAQCILNNPTARHFITAGVRNCDGFFSSEYFKEKIRFLRTDFSDEGLAGSKSPLTNGNPLIFEHLDTSTGWISVGMTTTSVVDVLMKKTRVKLFPTRETAWWVESLHYGIASVAFPFRAEASGLVGYYQQKDAQPNPSQPVPAVAVSPMFNLVIEEFVVVVPCEGQIFATSILSGVQVSSSENKVSVAVADWDVSIDFPNQDFLSLLHVKQLSIQQRNENIEVHVKASVEAVVSPISLQILGDQLKGATAFHTFASKLPHCDVAFVVDAEEIPVLEHCAALKSLTHYGDIVSVFEFLWVRGKNRISTPHHLDRSTAVETKPISVLVTVPGISVGFLSEAFSAADLRRLTADSASRSPLIATLDVLPSLNAVEPPSTSEDFEHSCNDAKLLAIRLHVGTKGESNVAFSLFDIELSGSGTQHCSGEVQMVVMSGCDLTVTSSTEGGSGAVRLALGVHSTEVKLCHGLVEIMEILLAAGAFGASLPLPLSTKEKLASPKALPSPECPYLIEAAVTFTDTLKFEAWGGRMTDDGTSGTADVKEMLLFTSEIEKCSLRFNDTHLKQSVAIDGTIGWVERVDNATGECMTFLGCGTSKRAFNEQTFTLSIETDKRDASTRDLKPLTTIRSTLEGGKVCFYAPFVCQLANFAQDSVMVRLAAAASRPESLSGYSSIHKCDSDFLTKASAVEVPADLLHKDWIELDIGVSQLEILLATNAHAAAAEEDPASYFYIACDKISVSSSRQLFDMDDKKPFMQQQVHVAGIRTQYGDEEDSPVYTILGEATITMSTNVLCAYEPSKGYRHLHSERVLDTTTQVVVNSAVDGGASVELNLSRNQWHRLVRFALQNLASVPSAPATNLPGCAVLLLQIPDFRFSVSCADCRSYSIQFGLIRMYQVAQYGQQHVTQTLSVDIEELAVLETSTVVQMYDPSHPRDKQQPRLLPSLGTRKLLVVKLIGIRHESQDASSTSTTVQVGHCSVQTFVSSFLGLRDALLSIQVEELMEATSAAVDSLPATQSTVVVEMADVNVHLIEPWGEVLASVLFDRLIISSHSQSDGAQTLSIVVPSKMAVRHNMFDLLTDVPNRYQFVVTGGGRSDDHDASQPTLRVSMVVAPPTKLKTQYHAGGVFHQFPEMLLPTTISIEATGFHVILVPAVLLRLTTYLSGELLLLSSISYNENQRQQLLTSPCFDGAFIVITAVNTSITVPSVIAVTNADDVVVPNNVRRPADPSVWHIKCPLISISNNVKRSTTAIVLAATPPGATPICFVDEYTLDIAQCVVKNSAFLSASPIVLPAVRLTTSIPLPLASMLEIAHPISGSDGTVVVAHHWQILPHPNVAEFTSSTSISLTDASIEVTPEFIEEVLRSLPLLQESFGSEKIKFYDVVPLFAINQEISASFSSLTVVVSDTCMDYSGDTPTRRKGSFGSSNQALGTLVAQPLLKLKVNSVNLKQHCLDNAKKSASLTVSFADVSGISLENSSGCVLVFHSNPNNKCVIAEHRQQVRREMKDKLTLMTNDIAVVADSNLIDLALAVQQFVQRLGERLATVETPQQVEAPQGSNAPPNSTLVEVTAANTTLILPEVAAFTVGKLSVVLESASVDPQVITIENASLSRRGGSKEAPELHYFELAQAEVKLAVGSVQARVNRARVFNHNSSFFLQVADSATFLMEYVAAKTSLPKQQEEGFKHSLTLSFSEFQVALFQAGAPSAHSSQRLDLLFPGFVIRHVATNVDCETIVDAEEGSVMYRNQASLLTICRGMAFAFQYKADYRKNHFHTILKLGKISVVAPIGHVLQSFVEVLAGSLLPLASFASMASEPAALPSLDEKKAQHLTTTSILLSAPCLSLHVCEPNVHSHRGGPNLRDGGVVPLQEASTLFGVELHDLNVAYRKAPDSEALELSLHEIKSVVDLSIQRQFIFARPLVVDSDVSPAIILRREVRIPQILGLAAKFASVADVEDAVDDLSEPMSRGRQETVLAKLYDFSITISPSLLGMINENILARVACATKVAREVQIEQSKQISFVTPRKKVSVSRDDGSTLNSSAAKHLPSGGTTTSNITISKGATSLQTNAARFLHISGVSEFTLRTDLYLGGKNGQTLRFCKDKRSLINTVVFKAPPGGVATVYVSLGELPDQTLYCPIVVDNGISVYCQNIRFVIQSPGASSVLDFADIGSRSFLHVDPGLTIIQSGPTGSATVSTAPPSGKQAGGRVVKYKVVYDVFAHVEARIWSFHQSVAVAMDISATFRQELERKEGPHNPRTLVDEQGEVSLSNVVISCDAGSITAEPTGIVAHISHHRPVLPSTDDDATQKTGDQQLAPRTLIRILMPHTRMHIAIGHLKLLYDIVRAIQRGSEHLGNIDTTVDMSGSFSAEDVEGRQHAIGKEMQDSSCNRTDGGRPLQYVLSTKLDTHSSSPAGSPSIVEIGINAPVISLTVTNDFFSPLVEFSVSNVAVAGHATRDGSSISLESNCAVELHDFPRWRGSQRRQLLRVMPEVVATQDAFKNASHKIGESVGKSMQIVVATSELTVTIPIVTAVQALRYEFSKQKTGAHSFLNNTGVPLVLIATEAGRNVEVEDTSPLCELPGDVLIKTDIFQYDQTLFRVVPGSMRSVVGRNMQSLGEEIDVRCLQANATVGLNIIDPKVCNPLNEIIMVLDEHQRLVTFSSCVRFRNDLKHLQIQLFSSEEVFAVEPLAEIRMPIPALQHPISLQVDGKWHLDLAAETPAFLQWDSLLNSFLAACDEEDTSSPGTAFAANPTSPPFTGEGAVFSNSILRIPLMLTDPESFNVSQKHLAVELRIERRPLSDYKRVRSPMHHKKPLVKYEVLVTLKPVCRFLNYLGAKVQVTVVTPGHGRKSVFVGNEASTDWFDAVRPSLSPASPADAELETSSSVLVEVFADKGVLTSTPCLLPSAEGTPVFVTLKDEERKETLIKLERTADGNFEIFGAALLFNHLPLAVEVFGPGGGAVPPLLAGQLGSLGVPPRATAPLLIGFSQQAMRDPQASIRVRACRSGARLSQAFHCSSVTVSNMLSSDEAHLVHIFSARRNVFNEKQQALKCPRVHLESLWHVKNTHPHLFMFVKCVALDDYVTTVLPGAEVPLLTFHSSTAADPSIQVAFSVEGQATFEWSCPLPLASLVSSTPYMTFRHSSKESQLTSSAIAPSPLYLGFLEQRDTAADAPHPFACLTVLSQRDANGQILLECTLADAAVILENRTPNAIVYHQKSSKPKKFSAMPFRDAAIAWESYTPHTTNVLVIEARCSKNKLHVITIDLMQRTAEKEPLIVADGLMVLCSFDTTSRQHRVAVVRDRLLESSLVLQSRSMLNCQFFCSKLSVFVAAPCADKSLKTLDNIPIAAFARRGEVAFVSSSDLSGDQNSKLREYELIQSLCKAELDIALLEVNNIYANICSNKHHSFGEFSIHSLALMDCSVPSPLHPTVLKIDPRPVVDFRKKTVLLPCFSLRLHLGESPEIDPLDKLKSEVIPYFIRSLHVRIEPIHIKVNDAFLFAVREVVNLVVAKVNEHYETLSPEDKSVQQRSSSNHSIRCFLDRFSISAVEVVFTLTRRSDGKFNPFYGIPMGSFLLQSIEEAPLNLNEVARSEVQQSAPNVLSAICSLVVPWYRTQVILQLYKIVGSFEVLGNPIMFASQVSAGVKSFVRDTVELHPLQGAKSLLQFTTASAFHSVALLSRVGGRTAALVGMDKEWLEQHEQDQAEDADRGGLIWGIASGVLGGITGVFRDPVKGFRQGGAAGFASGVASGVLGIVTRPVSGLLDGLGNSAERVSLALKHNATDDDINVGSMTPLVESPSVMTKRNFVLPTTGTSRALATSSANTPDASRSPRNEAAQPIGCVDVNAFMSNGDFVEAVQAIPSKTDSDRWRIAIELHGAHNVARHVTWKDYLKIVNDNEFILSVQIALDRLLTLRLLQLASSSSRVHLRVSVSHADVVRAQNIKNSLGAKDSLKYITVEQFIRVCSLAEMKAALPAEEIHKRISHALHDHTLFCMEELLKQRWK